MVQVINFEKRKNSKGEEFHVLELQGQVEMIRATGSGKFYAHAHKTSITTTLNEASCRGLIGTKFPGVIKKVECEPYAYKVPNTNDTLMLTHNYQYLADETANIEEAVFSGEVK
jgi:hypothetical protein